MKSIQRAKESVLEGKLEDVPLADIIQVLQVGAKSGALLLNRGDGHTAVIAFRGGAIIQAMSTESYQSLGDGLLTMGAITRGDLQDALDYMARFPGMRVGDALVELSTISRPKIEEAVKALIAETMDRLMGWTTAEFEFQVGFVSLPRGLPALAIDLIDEKGIQPREFLLRAGLRRDARAGAGSRAESAPENPAEPPQAGGGREQSEKVDAQAEKIIRWFNDGDPLPSSDLEDRLGVLTAASYLSISEELFVASGRGEIGLLLLRYASELYADGGLVMKTKDGFRVLGQFGEAFAWGELPPSKTAFATGESPLFDTIAAERRPYVGFAAVTRAGGLSPAARRAADARLVLAVPLLVLGDVSLILLCRTAVAGAPDARALIALARQVSVTLENAALREVAKRRVFAGAGSEPAAGLHPATATGAAQAGDPS